MNELEYYLRRTGERHPEDMVRRLFHRGEYVRAMLVAQDAELYDLQLHIWVVSYRPMFSPLSLFPKPSRLSPFVEVLLSRKGHRGLGGAVHVDSRRMPRDDYAVFPVLGSPLCGAHRKADYRGKVFDLIHDASTPARLCSGCCRRLFHRPRESLPAWLWSSGESH